MKVRVLVRLRPGILDVPGAAVQRALGDVGLGGVRELRIGKLVELDLEAGSAAEAAERADAMARRLLANPVLEDYAIEVLESGTGSPGAPEGAVGRTGA